MDKLHKSPESAFGEPTATNPETPETREMTMAEIYEKLEEIFVRDIENDPGQLNAICGGRGSEPGFWNGFFDVFGGIGALGCTENLEPVRRMPYGGFLLDRMRMCQDRQRWGGDMQIAMDRASEKTTQVKTESS